MPRLPPDCHRRWPPQEVPTRQDLGGTANLQVPIVCPPADRNRIQPQTYAALLKASAGMASPHARLCLQGCPAGHLRWSCHLLSWLGYAVSFRNLVQAADPQHLLLAEVPFSQLLGRHIVLVYDASSQVRG